MQAENANAMGSWLLNIGRDDEAVGMHASVLPLLDAEEHARTRAATLDRLGMSNGLAGRLDGHQATKARPDAAAYLDVRRIPAAGV